ncbi:hypothetical protein FC093_06350 [Ilyomonas limi]|uniref:Uncharacterized protein n=1 Tax=Ilyomonas limi TaxID=2575867 RepID=A0A4U3L7K1_9BACT|nr:hypothetical protein [Ilyomonas limi]TKK70364.1 hypothetical protein FC093_06350 [Ilyomonas limi]
MVRINAYQYTLLNGSRRVSRFVTKSAITDPVHADDYVFDYTYNSDGFLTTKSLYINGSANANFSTLYSYTKLQINNKSNTY